MWKKVLQVWENWGKTSTQISVGRPKAWTSSHTAKSTSRIRHKAPNVANVCCSKRDTCCRGHVPFDSLRASTEASGKNSMLPGKQSGFKKEVRGLISVSCWGGGAQGKSSQHVSILSTQPTAVCLHWAGVPIQVTGNAFSRAVPRAKARSDEPLCGMFLGNCGAAHWSKS